MRVRGRIDSVPSSFFQIRSKQEHDLKVRNFLPPQAADPEMFVIDGRADPARRANGGQVGDIREGEREDRGGASIAARHVSARSRTKPVLDIWLGKNFPNVDLLNYL